MLHKPSENTDKLISYFDYARTILLGENLEDKYFSADIEWSPYIPFELPEKPGRFGTISFSDKQIKFPKAPNLNQKQNTAIALHSFANHELLAIEMMAAAILIYPHANDDDIRFKKGIVSALKDEQKHLSLYIGRLNELGYKFGDFPLNDLVHRTRTLILPPGADEFWVTCTPATLAFNPCARLLTAVCFSSSPFMVATEPVIAAFLWVP